MFKKKYVICPGAVVAVDGDLHRITSAQLIRLYNVNIKECIIGVNRKGRTGGLIELHPRRDGKYLLPGGGPNV